MLWFNDAKYTKFLFFIYFIANKKKKIILEENKQQKESYLYMKSVLVFDLPKIRVGWARKAKIKLHSPNAK